MGSETVVPELVAEETERLPLWRRLGDRVSKQLRAQVKKMGPIDADLALQGAMAACIEGAAARYPLDPGAKWRPGEPLRLLFVGYAGTRNTGADVRVEEMVRQVRHLLGDDWVDLSILTLDPELTRGYFRTVKQLVLPNVFPAFITAAVHAQHGVIACEGSMFKSKFANALSTLMVGGLGLALAEHKLAIAYGGEAGAMDPSLEAMVRRYCQGAWMMARNEASVGVLAKLGIEAQSGTDTAWTFEPAPPAVGERILREAGWDGIAPVLAVAPIHPFWWPVKPDMWKGALRATVGAYAQDHYQSIYFHHGGDAVEEAFERYLDGLAEGARAFAAERGAFVVMVGMEALDRRACEGLAGRLDGAPCLVSDSYDMFEMISMLRRCRWLVTSRYHAAVCSMPEAVLSVGVTMDERLRNLFADRGTPGLCLTVDQPDLGEALLAALNEIEAEHEAVALGIRRTVARNLVKMGEMGRALVDHIRAKHPDFPMNPELGGEAPALAHLPSLSAAAKRCLQELE